MPDTTVSSHLIICLISPGCLLLIIVSLGLSSSAHTRSERTLHLKVGLRLRGGGAQQSTLAPKYQSNRALKPEEFTPPFGTLIRSRSGALFSPTPTPHWLVNVFRGVETRGWVATGEQECHPACKPIRFHTFPLEVCLDIIIRCCTNDDDDAYTV